METILFSANISTIDVAMVRKKTCAFIFNDKKVLSEKLAGYGYFAQESAVSGAKFIAWGVNSPPP